MSRCTLAVVAAFLATAAPAIAQSPGRLELRGMLGAGIPIAPSDFREGWTTGLGASIEAGYHLSDATTLGLRIEFQHFGTLPILLAGQSGQSRRLGGTNTAWAAWLDGAWNTWVNPSLRARLHGGIGGVSFGPAVTSVAFDAGVGLDIPVTARLSAISDVSVTHTLVDDLSGNYRVASPYSYLSVRAGMSWR
jgi:hypothetical protein